MKRLIKGARNTLLLAIIFLGGLLPGAAHAVNYRMDVNGRAYLVHDRVNYQQRSAPFNRKIGPSTFKELVAGMNRDSVYQGGPGASSGWYLASHDEMQRVNYITDVGGEGAGTLGWLHAPGGQLQYVGQGYNVHFAKDPHSFGKSPPYTDDLITRMQDVNACSSDWWQCEEHTRPIIESGVHGIDFWDDKHRVVLALPNLRDYDADLHQAFFEYQKWIGNEPQTDWEPIRTDWIHSLWYDHPTLGWVTADYHDGAWVHVYSSNLQGPGKYKFRGFAKDTGDCDKGDCDKGGRSSDFKESIEIQIWGPPEVQHVQVPESPMLGQNIEATAHFFDPNGDLGNYNAELWEVDDSGEQHRVEHYEGSFDQAQMGARTQMSFTLHPRKTGRYIFKVGCWDAREQGSGVSAREIYVDPAPEIFYAKLEDGSDVRSLEEKRSDLAARLQAISNSTDGHLEFLFDRCDGDAVCLSLNERTGEGGRSLFFQALIPFRGTTLWSTSVLQKVFLQRLRTEARILFLRLRICNLERLRCSCVSIPMVIFISRRSLLMVKCVFGPLEISHQPALKQAHFSLRPETSSIPNRSRLILLSSMHMRVLPIGMIKILLMPVFMPWKN